MSSYDQAASAKWHNVWLFLIVVSLMFVDWSLRGIASAIRECRVEVRVQGGKVTK